MMKLLHLADLHFGKSLFAQPLLEDQAYWTERLLESVRREQPDVVLIAGDVYDRGVPGKEAVQLLSRLLTELAACGCEVLLTAGNHDGGERLEFASELLANQHVHIAGTLRQELISWTGEDAFGPVTFWLLPYTTPAAVRTVWNVDDSEVSNYTEALRFVLEHQPIDESRRNVLIAHQTVLPAAGELRRAPSETAIGGVGGIDAAIFERFDYVALGHIHGAQMVGSARIRYAGAPLCYHFGEVGEQKGLLYVTLGEKGSEPRCTIEELPTLHRVRKPIVDSLQHIIENETAHPGEREYVSVVLTDSRITPQAHETLRELFASHGSVLLDLTRRSELIAAHPVDGTENAERKSLADYFGAFYRSRRADGADPDASEWELIAYLARQVEDRPDESEQALVAALVDQAVRAANDELKGA